MNTDARIKRKKGYFSISAVAKMFSVHQQTVRLYEKEGLITPKRSAGNTRLFSEEDVDKLEQIIYLTHELGINLAGVEMVLRLQKQIKKLQKEINAAFVSAHDALTKDVDVYKTHSEDVARKLVRIVKEKKGQKNSESLLPVVYDKVELKGSEKKKEKERLLEEAGWHIEYEE